jgi:hypothetical protein
VSVPANVTVLDHHDALATAVALHHHNTLIEVSITIRGADGNPFAGKGDRLGELDAEVTNPVAARAPATRISEIG